MRKPVIGLDVAAILAAALTLIFIALRYNNVIDWSAWWITAPLWFFIAGCILFVLASYLAVAVVSILIERALKKVSPA